MTEEEKAQLLNGQMARYGYNAMCMSICTNLYNKLNRKDLTPRQIEWCKAWIPAFNPKVAT